MKNSLVILSLLVGIEACVFQKNRSYTPAAVPEEAYPEEEGEVGNSAEVGRDETENETPAAVNNDCSEILRILDDAPSFNEIKGDLVRSSNGSSTWKSEVRLSFFDVNEIYHNSNSSLKQFTGRVTITPEADANKKFQSIDELIRSCGDISSFTRKAYSVSSGWQKGDYVEYSSSSTERWLRIHIGESMAQPGGYEVILLIR